jgi:uncharacterized protein YkwD
MQRMLLSVLAAVLLAQAAAGNQHWARITFWARHRSCKSVLGPANAPPPPKATRALITHTVHHAGACPDANAALEATNSLRQAQALPALRWSMRLEVASQV